MDRIVNIGIIGCGGIANGKHMPSLKKIPNVRMIAFCDVIPERAEKAAREYGTPDAKVYTDYRELLKNPEVEVVHVLTPNREHADITIDALYAGKHVMCEKPMAKTAADARRMVEAAKKTGKKLTIGYQHRQKPQICRFAFNVLPHREYLLPVAASHARGMVAETHGYILFMDLRPTPLQRHSRADSPLAYMGYAKGRGER